MYICSETLKSTSMSSNTLRLIVGLLIIFGLLWLAYFIIKILLPFIFIGLAIFIVYMLYKRGKLRF